MCPTHLYNRLSVHYSVSKIPKVHTDRTWKYFMQNFGSLMHLEPYLGNHWKSPCRVWMNPTSLIPYMWLPSDFPNMVPDMVGRWNFTNKLFLTNLLRFSFQVWFMQMLGQICDIVLSFHQSVHLFIGPSICRSITS